MPLQLERTPDDFTTGIVNIPLNTPAFFFLKVRDMKLLQQAKDVFQEYLIPFEHEQKSRKAILKSSTMVDRKIINRIHHDYPQFEPTAMNYYRYVFFELDELNDKLVSFVLSVYQDYRLPVYYHRTMRGWHFFCVKPVDEPTYHEIMNKLKPLNMACPHVTMRIRPNKWVGEPEVFKIGNVVMPAKHSDTERFAKTIQEQTYARRMQAFGKGKYILDNKYFIVNYRQTGELANK